MVLCADSLNGVTLTPSDSYGNTWIPIAGPTSTTTGSDLRTEIWYAWNPVVGPGHTVTVVLSSGEALVMSVVVVQNANVSSPIDGVSLIGSDNGTDSEIVTSPSLLTTIPNDLLIGFSKVGFGATFTAGAGFTLQAAASANFLAAETGPAATPGSYAAAFTVNENQTWQAAITAAANNPIHTTLSWTGSTGGSGTIREYLVWRCQGAGCSNFVQIGTTTSTTYNDISPVPSTSYTYEVQAEDTAFTLGAFSTMTVVTPAPTPSLPGNLTVAAASSTQNNLSWTASHETGGGTIASYLIERCTGAGCTNFAFLTTSATTTYTDTVTANTSYTYQVQAKDAVGNVSPFSNVATDVTPGP